MSSEGIKIFFLMPELWNILIASSSTEMYSCINIKSQLQTCISTEYRCLILYIENVYQLFNNKEFIVTPNINNNYYYSYWITLFNQSTNIIQVLSNFSKRTNKKLRWNKKLIVKYWYNRKILVLTSVVVLWNAVVMAFLCIICLWKWTPCDTCRCFTSFSRLALAVSKIVSLKRFHK